MLKKPENKYAPFPPVSLPDRRWPTQTITKAPIWMSSDLRDGNQALFEPMSVEQKIEVFATLCDIGFKEIEVAFPSASQTEFQFVRRLIEENRIPENVSIVVLTQAREHLVQRTMEAIKGAKSAIVHVYNGTSKHFMNQVLKLSPDEVIEMATSAIKLVKELAQTIPQTQVLLEYSPEHFSSTDLDFAVKICNAVTKTWGASFERKVIFNLPATVEVAMPNVYADQIEWMHRNLEHRESVIISVHPHNDRGTGVAAAELGLLAGADRVEGCLFGNGERTGNVDLMILALNLYTQGIAPGLNFSNINHIARTMEACTQLPIHPRHPYVGDLVFTAFSGSHQDAIKKGLALHKEGDRWAVPYMPIDPADLGRSYDSIIRVNSQSGKGGVAYLLENYYGIVMPRRMQVRFAQTVQNYTDEHGSEVTATILWDIFEQTYLAKNQTYELISHHLVDNGKTQTVDLTVLINDKKEMLTGQGNGPIDAAIQALTKANIKINVRSYEERAMKASNTGGDAKACAIIELTFNGAEWFGVGIDENIVTASFKAIISALNRATSESEHKP